MSELKLETTEQIASYGIGRQMGDQLANNSFEGVSLNAVVTGIQDAFEGAELKVAGEQIQAAFNEIQKRMQEEAEAAAKKQRLKVKSFWRKTLSVKKYSLLIPACSTKLLKRAAKKVKSHPVSLPFAFTTTALSPTVKYSTALTSAVSLLNSLLAA